jgi:hypothetical protein
LTPSNRARLFPYCARAARTLVRHLTLEHLMPLSIRRLTSPLVLAVASFVAGPSLAAQGGGSVRGKVTNAATGAPIAGAQVFVVGTRVGGVSAADGSYTFSGVGTGPQVVRMRAIGFKLMEQNVTVSGGAAAVADFSAATAAITLDEVVVTGTAGSARKREVGNSIGQLDLRETPRCYPAAWPA